MVLFDLVWCCCAKHFCRAHWNNNKNGIGSKVATAIGWMSFEKLSMRDLLGVTTTTIHSCLSCSCCCCSHLYYNQNCDASIFQYHATCDRMCVCVCAYECFWYTPSFALSAQQKKRYATRFASQCQIETCTNTAICHHFFFAQLVFLFIKFLKTTIDYFISPKTNRS